MSFGDAVAAIVQDVVQLTRSNALAAEDGRPIEAGQLTGAVAVYSARRGGGGLRSTGRVGATE